MELTTEAKASMVPFTYFVCFVFVVVLLEEHHTKPPEKTKRK